MLIQNYNNKSVFFSINKIQNFDISKKYEQQHKQCIDDLKILCFLLKIRFTEVIKDEFNKPYLQNNNQYNISFTHCDKFIAVAISRYYIGIDLEKISSRFKHIQHKFLHNTEINQCKNDNNQLCSYWTIKESVYKTSRNYLKSLKNIKISNPYIAEDIYNDIYVYNSNTYKLDNDFYCCTISILKS